MTITVSLPDLAPGYECPHCGALRIATPATEIIYACGSQYWSALGADRTVVWRSGRSCHCPSTSAVVAAMRARGDKPSDILDAVLAGLTPEQRERIAFQERAMELSPRDLTVKDCGEAAADALETP